MGGEWLSCWLDHSEIGRMGDTTVTVGERGLEGGGRRKVACVKQDATLWHV